MLNVRNYRPPKGGGRPFRIKDPTSACEKNVPCGSCVRNLSGKLHGRALNLRKVSVFSTVDKDDERDMDGQEQRERSDRLQRLGLEPEDYYFSKEGYLVFTEQYHLKRGYCCQSGCRHCPYGFNTKRQPSDRP